MIACGGFAGRAEAASDYRIDSREWNGLSKLDEEARAAGCDLRADGRLDWSALDGHDVLWLVYPRVAVDGGRLRRFLEAGGRAVIADDFGTSDGALAALQIRRLRGELGDTEHWEDNPALPIAHQSLATELSVGIPQLVANHPAFFSTAVPPTYAFSPGAALVVEGRLGKGYFVAIADPSVLINNMLELPDDLDFARALVKRTCGPGDRVHLLTQSFAQAGDPGGDWTADDGSSLFTRFNRMLGGINDSLHRALYGSRAPILEIALALLVAWRFLRAAPERTRVDGAWTRAAPALQSGWQPHVDRVATSTRGLGLAAMVLRDEVLTRLSESLDGAAVGDWSTDELARRVAQVHGSEAAAALRELWRRLGRLGRRGGGPVREPSLSRQQFERLASDARRLFDALDARRQAG
jgi:hypothetical protein